PRGGRARRAGDTAPHSPLLHELSALFVTGGPVESSAAYPCAQEYAAAMRDDLTNFVASVDLLQHVSPATLAAFVAACQVRELRAGEALFREGDPGEFLFVVK